MNIEQTATHTHTHTHTLHTMHTTLTGAAQCDVGTTRTPHDISSHLCFLIPVSYHRSKLVEAMKFKLSALRHSHQEETKRLKLQVVN
jgi:hypothetical protein